MSESQTQHPEPPGVGVPERLRPLLHERERICAELESLAGKDDEVSRTRAAGLGADYRRCEPLPPEYAEIMDRRFAAAEAAFAEGLTVAAERREKREQVLETLHSLLTEQARLSASPRLLPHRREFERLRKNWRVAATGVDDLDLLEKAFADSSAAIAARMESEAAAAVSAREALAGLRGELEAARAADRPEEFKEKREGWEAARDAAAAALDPDSPEDKALLGSIRELFKELNDRLVLYYQTLDLARWESYTLKLDLCRELEQLRDTPEEKLPAAAVRLREIRKRWQELGAVPREKQNELGPRYYEYTTALQHRIDDFFKAQRAAHAAAAEKKTALCEAAEALRESTRWNETSEQLKALQAEWKTIGHAGREADGALYARFRAACDVFFNARAQYWAEKQQLQNEVGARKRELCAAAEALSTLPVQEAVRRAKQLRADFQVAGRAGKQEQSLNARFNSAMEAFFNSRHEAVQSAKNRREEILRELESLAAMPPVQAEQRMGELRTEWRSLEPLPREQDARYEARARAAAAELEKALAAVRRRQQRERADWLIPAMRAAAEVVTAARRGEPLPEVTLDLTPFPRLAALVTDVVAAGGRCPDGMDKALSRNAREFGSLLEEWEKTTGSRRGTDAAQDLAADLAAAIAGNFGGSAMAAVRKKETEPAALLRRLLDVGLPEPEQLGDLLSRYASLRATMNGAGSRDDGALQG